MPPQRFHVAGEMKQRTDQAAKRFARTFCLVLFFITIFSLYSFALTHFGSSLPPSVQQHLLRRSEDAEEQLEVRLSSVACIEYWNIATNFARSSAVESTERETNVPSFEQTVRTKTPACFRT